MSEREKITGAGFFVFLVMVMVFTGYVIHLEFEKEMALLSCGVEDE